MRHAKKRHQLNRFTSWNKATLKSLARNVVINQSIKTTLHRAKAAKPLIDSLIVLAKKNTLAAKRDAFKVLGDHKLVSLLFSEIGPRFAKRNEGYTRILGLGFRRGDSAKLAILEFTEIKKKEVKKSKKTKEAPKEAEEAAKEAEEKPAQEHKDKSPDVHTMAREEKKPNKKFLGGIRSIFKKERDSL
ncbi:MAG: 50S ribosomal protein L17 [Candidatus Omnitrophota bacterium]